MDKEFLNENETNESQNSPATPAAPEATPAAENNAESEAANNAEAASTESAAAPEKAESAPAAAPAEGEAKPAAKKCDKKKQPVKVVKTSFGKIFLAALLAVIVGSVLSFFIMIGFFSSVSTRMAPKATAVPETAILHLDFAESIVDLPSSNPMDSFDFMSMTQSSSISLYSALQALDAAATDERI